MNDNKITKYNMFNPNKSKSKIAVRSSVLAQHLLTIGSPLPKKRTEAAKKQNKAPTQIPSKYLRNEVGNEKTHVQPF